MPTVERLLLLDLHYTFAIPESWHRGARLVDRIPKETYRTWIIDLAKKNNVTVVLTTARPQHYLYDTLDRIMEVTDWQPDGAYFRQIEAQPHIAKEHNLERIIEDYGDPTPNWVAFESNERTRSMYRRRGIRAIPVHRTSPLTEWPWTDDPPRSLFALP